MKLKASDSTDYVHRYELVDDQEMTAGVSVALGASPKGIANWFTVRLQGQERELLVRLTEGNELGKQREVTAETYERLMLAIAEHVDAVRRLLQEPDGNAYLSIVLPGGYQRSVPDWDGKKTRVEGYYQSRITMHANRRDLEKEPGSSEVAELVSAARALLSVFIRANECVSA
jgi:hypothetical protein